MKENNSLSIDGFSNYNNNLSKNNSMENNINNYSAINPQISTIKKRTTIPMSGIKTMKEMLDDIKIPYPNKDEIPLIKIKNENFFENDKPIENYIKSLSKFNDNKFNICRECKKERNKFFCQNCNKNICDDICAGICLSYNHTLIELEKLLDEVNENKMSINLIISKYFILPKEKQNADEIIKKNINYQIMDEYEINNEIEEKPMEYTNDIVLIEAIKEKNYNNYFHYLNIKECFFYMKKKYKDNLDSIIIKYKIGEYNTKIKIFGKKFVQNNKNNCHLIHGNKKYGLTEFFELYNFDNKKTLEIKLIGINNILDSSFMFYGCKSLISLPDINILKTNNIMNMSYMFCGCKSLKSLPDISKWNTNNITDISYMFSGCESLISLPDISKWNIINVTNMKSLFSYCSSLKSLPDISKWNTNNVTNINWIFSNCKSLISLPDISKWNSNNIKHMIGIFNNCQSLISLPDITKWNKNNLNDISLLAHGCTSLKWIGKKDFSFSKK